MGYRSMLWDHSLLLSVDIGGEEATTKIHLLLVISMTGM